ncbi:MAG: class I SAM-dependent methyltransferase [Alphaproteobacteria bacterium]|nr:class I SAM-dependent methyltransferase [Alphaproteobacteria bacterium]
MSSLSQRLKERYFGRYQHPYAVLRRRVEDLLPLDATLLDAGCGRSAPTLAHFRGRARRLIGIDRVAFAGASAGLELRQRDLADTGVASGAVDLMYSQAVLEHVTDPDATFAEIARVLRPGGRYVGLTANKWDYASLAARLIPNCFHPWIVRRTEGRDEQDVFPTVYRANTRRDVARYAARHGLELVEFRYLGQYPNYFMFNGALFLAATAYQKIIERLAPLHCLQGWIFFVLRKPETPMEMAPVAARPAA